MRAEAVKLGRRTNLAACFALARPYLDGFEHDGTLNAVAMTIRGEPAFGARFNRATTLYPVGPRNRTMMQSCASAAKLRSGGPILPFGMKAKGRLGIPPPRTVICVPSQALERRRIKGFRNRTRSARRRMQAIQRMSIRQRQEQQTATYRELIGIAEEVIESARAALRQTRKARSKGMITDLAIAETRKEIEHFCGLGDRVIDQSRRRVLNGEQVPTVEKLYSIFEPHTDLIKRGKVQSPIEFGHKVFLAESARGLITQYDLLDGNPIDEQ